MRVTSPFRNRRWILRSSGGLPFCTSAPQVSSDSSVCFLEEPVAPPQPSRPVLPPSRMTMSPASGTSRMTFSSRGRADDRADLHTLGYITRVIDLMHQAGRQADLVAVGGIARRRGRGTACAAAACLGSVFGERHRRVARAGHAHRPDKHRSGRRAGRGSRRRGRSPRRRTARSRSGGCGSRF